VGVLDASNSPPKERYVVSNDNVVMLIQPGAFDDQLTEINASDKTYLTAYRLRSSPATKWTSLMQSSPVS
jgi:hypothetical protein